MAKVHDRVLAVAITADESADTTVATAVTYYRDRGASGFSVKFTAGAAAATHEIAFGEVFPPPTHLQIISTFQA